MKRIVKHELIEVIVPANSTATRFQLPDAQNLRNVQTWGIQVYYDKIIPISIISNRKVVTKKDAQSSFITFENYSGREFDKQAPILQYQTIENGFNNDPSQNIESSIQEKDFKNFVGQKINFPKSYIDVVTPIADTFDKVFLISIYYTDKGENFSRTSFDQKH